MSFDRFSIQKFKNQGISNIPVKKYLVSGLFTITVCF